MWKELKDSNNNTYYYNEETGATTWEKPLEAFSILERALEDSNWAQFKSKDTGQVYYFNRSTNESVWELPQEIQDAVSILESKNTKQETVAEVPSKSDIAPEKYANHSELLKLVPNNNESSFIQMLREIGVDSTWSFSKILDVCIKDKRYWLIEDSLAKKQIFEKFLSNRTKDELLKENQSIEKFKDAFLKLLQSYDQIVYYTRWKTVKNLIKDEPIYVHSVISEKVKKQTFQSYVDGLRTKHEQSHERLKVVALEELQDYFQSHFKISLDSKWDDIIQRINNDKRFQENKHFELLEKLDILKLYQKTLHDLQKEQILRIKAISERNYRSDRISRDNYRQLLTELKETGLLTADTKWSEVFPLIENDDRFLGLLDRNGSNPLELFWDLIDDEELILRGKKDYVEQLLVHNDIKVDSALTQDDIKQTTLKDEQTKSYDDTLIELIWERIQKDLKEREEKDRIARERKVKKAKDEFLNFLTTLGWINIESKWDDVKDKISDSYEFKNLEDDETRVLVFDKFIKTLQDRFAEVELLKQQNIKRVINEVTSGGRNVNPKKRPLSPKQPVVELDY